jgi:PKD repeat protein
VASRARARSIVSCGVAARRSTSRTLALLLLALIAAAGSAPSGAADDDTTPPVLVGLSFSPSSVDTAGGSQTITVAAHITDDLAGFGTGFLEFRGPSGQYLRADFRQWMLVSGSLTDGVFESVMTVGAFSEQGTWTAVDFYLSDQASNQRVFSDFAGAGFPTGFDVGPANVAPTVSAITGAAAPVSVGRAVTVSATFTDPNPLDTHTARWDWGDGTTSAGAVTENGGSGTLTGAHTYAAAGIYTIGLTVTDQRGGAGQTSVRLIVYDPAAGFITGSGSIASPPGAYTADFSLTGKAIFSFASRYQKGATRPTGQTQFRLASARLSFQSTSYEWLVVSGARAQYQGSGTVGGKGGYEFIVTAIDGQITGGGGVDKLRIKIWNKSTGAVVYDNQPGAPDTANPTTAIAGGSISIQT